jgi:hypothetical protein
VIKVRSLEAAKDCSYSLCVQTGSVAHPAFYTMGPRGPFTGAEKRLGRYTDHLSPSSTEVVNEELYILPPPQAPSIMNRAALLLHHTYQSVVTHQDVAATHTAIQPTHHMYLALLWGTTCVYTTYGLCSAPRLAHRCSQKDGPNLHSLSIELN